MKKMKYAAIVPAFLFLLSACSTSKITDSWRAEKKPEAHYSKILVVGLFDEKNRSLRSAMEQELVDELHKEGLAAVSSYKEFGPESYLNQKPDELLQLLENNNVDAVITINLTDKNEVKKYVQNPPYYNPPGYVYNPWWGWRYRPWGYYTYGNGHYENNTNYSFETNLYDVSEKKLLYSAESASYDPGGINNLANDYSKTVIKDLKKNNLLGS